MNQKKPDKPEHRPLMDSIRDFAGLSHDAGLLDGWRQAADFCIRLSGSYYIAGRDEEAALARQLGKDIRAEELNRREQFDKHRNELQDEKYDEIVGILEGLHVVPKDATDELIAEVRRRRNE